MLRRLQSASFVFGRFRPDFFRSEAIAAMTCAILNGFAIMMLFGTPFDFQLSPFAPLT